MGDVKAEGTLSAGVERLALDASVILARAEFSAEGVERARRQGRLEMAYPAGGKAYLEVGGVAIAEGVVKRRRGAQVFVVTKAYSASEEAIR